MEKVAAGGTPSRHGNLPQTVTMATCSPKSIKAFSFLQVRRPFVKYFLFRQS